MRWVLTTAVTVMVVAAHAAEKPNVLFLAVDDLNDWVGVLGKRTDVKTPNIDRLAKQGVLFTRAYCAAPACNPSRAALMTGLRPSTSGVYHNNQPWRRALPNAITLAQYFMKHGYRVEGGGKIFHNSFNDAASWQHWEKAGEFPHPARLPHNGIAPASHFDWGPVDADDQEMGDYKVAQWAADFLAKPQEKPFFLAAGMLKPHLPFFAPKKYFDLYPLDSIALPKVIEGDLSDIPEAGRKMARPEGDHRKVLAANQWKKAIQAYLACITFTDTMLGMILDALEKSPHAKNTIVVLWSDHGWHLGEKEHWRKFALWEEATRVMLTIQVPGVTKPSTCDRTVGLIDLYPTLVELCGLPAKDGLEGVSLVPLLKDPSTAWDRPALTTHGRNHHAIRSEKYRYIRYADGSEELYDHTSDPLEGKNLASDPTLAGVKQGLSRYFPTTNAPDAPAEREKNIKKK